MRTKRELLIFLLAALLLVSGSACGTDSQDAAAAIGNNGGQYVKQGSYTYYREYTSANFEEVGLMGGYALIPDTSKKMMRIDDIGNKEALFDDVGSGAIFIYNGHMYLHTGESLYDSSSSVYSVDLMGNDKKEHGEGFIHALDTKKGVLICKNPGSYGVAIMDCKTGEKEIISNSSFLCYDYDKSVLYFTFDDAPEGTIKIGSVRYDETAKKQLAAFDANIYGGGPMAYIQQTQLATGYLYFSYGIYAGSGNYYQGGKIARVKTNGCGFEELAGTDGSFVGDEFIVLRKGNSDYLIYDDWSRPGGSSYSSLSLRNGKTEPTDLSPHSINLPFFEEVTLEKEVKNAEVSIYPDNTGNKKALITSRDFEKVGVPGGIYYEAETLHNVRDTELAGNWVYFTIESGEHTPEEDIGWRYAYARTRTEVYRKQLSTGRIELLYSY